MEIQAVSGGALPCKTSASTSLWQAPSGAFSPISTAGGCIDYCTAAKAPASS